MFGHRQDLASIRRVPDGAEASGYARVLTDPSLNTPITHSWSEVWGDHGTTPLGEKIGLSLTLSISGECHRSRKRGARLFLARHSSMAMAVIRDSAWCSSIADISERQIACQGLLACDYAVRGLDRGCS